MTLPARCGAAHSNLYGSFSIFNNYVAVETGMKKGPDVRKLRNVRAA